MDDNDKLEDFNILNKITYFVNYMTFKNNLINGKEEQLVDTFGEEDTYNLFLMYIKYFLEIDGPLIYMDQEIGKKIHSILNTRRFEYKDKEDNQYINDVIGTVNSLMYAKEEDKIIGMEDYTSDIVEDRGVLPSSPRVLLNINSSDILYYMYLTSDFNVPEWSDEMFLISLNYLINTMPEIFKDDVLDKTKNTLKIISDRTKFFDKYGKKLLKISNSLLNNIGSDS